MLCYKASDLVLHCLPSFIKNDVRCTRGTHYVTTFITPPTNAAGFYSICETKYQRLAFQMVHSISHIDNWLQTFKKTQLSTSTISSVLSIGMQYYPEVVSFKATSLSNIVADSESFSKSIFTAAFFYCIS